MRRRKSTQIVEHESAVHLHELPGWLVATCVVLLIANRFAFHFFASPLPDEAYYWLWGQRPALSYYDHPPLQAWFQGLTQSLLGTSLFALRLPSLISSVVLATTLVWWARRFDPSLSGLRLLGVVAVVFASPLIFVFMTITFNDHLLVALLSVASVFVFKAFDELERNERVRVGALYGAAVFIGLAGLTKYNAVFFAAGVVVALICFSTLRPLLRSFHLYMAGLVCLACLAPVFWWNFNNGGASFQYNLSDRVGAASSWNQIGSRIVALLVSAALLLSPFLAGAIVSAARWRGERARWITTWRRMSFSILLTGLTLCVALSFFIHVLTYWAIIAIVAVLPLGAFSFRRNWQLGFHMVYGVVIISLFTLNSIVLPGSALVGETDSDSGIMFGWADISLEVERLEQVHGVDFVVASDYRSGAILAFWSNNPETDVIATRFSQFTIWFDEDQRAGQDALILTSGRFPMQRVISNRFEKIEEVSQLSVQRFGFKMADYTFYVGKKYLSKK